MAPYVFHLEWIEQNKKSKHFVTQSLKVSTYCTSNLETILLKKFGFLRLTFFRTAFGYPYKVLRPRMEQIQKLKTLLLISLKVYNWLKFNDSFSSLFLTIFLTERKVFPHFRVVLT